MLQNSAGKAPEPQDGKFSFVSFHYPDIEKKPLHRHGASNSADPSSPCGRCKARDIESPPARNPPLRNAPPSLHPGSRHFPALANRVPDVFSPAPVGTDS